jgi:O-antigen/teichoic acid export membrane protein
LRCRGTWNRSLDRGSFRKREREWRLDAALSASFAMMDAARSTGAKTLRVTSARQVARRLFGCIDTEEVQQRRHLGILQGVVSGLGNRLISVMVSFLSVPLAIGYLGTERYGAWLTIGSLLAWFGLADVGLGNGLTNAIATAVGQDRLDLARMHVSNGIFLLCIPATVVGLAAYLAWPFVDWSGLFGLSSAQAHAEIGPAIALSIVIFLAQLPISVIGKVLMALHEGRIANYWSAIGNILSFLALMIVTKTHCGLPWLILAVSGTSMIVNYISAGWLFLLHKPNLAPGLSYINFRAMYSLAYVGSQFFFIQIAALVVFQTDNLFVSHFLGAARVPEYSLTYNLFTYTSLPQSLLFSYLWNAYAEAIARRDIAWVKKALHLNLALGLAFTAVTAVGLAVIAKPFLAWWGGPGVVPSSELIGWMAGWSMIYAFANPIACLLAAASHLGAQIKYAAACTLSNLLLSYFLIQSWGVQGVTAATVISYAIFVCIPTYIDTKSLLHRLE